MLFKQNETAFLHDVIPHEVSHLLTWQLFNKVKPHGKEWQAIMVEVFKRAPNTTHSFDVKTVAGQQFAYQCGCSTHLLSARRHNNSLRGTQYACRKCNTRLTPTSENAIN